MCYFRDTVGQCFIALISFGRRVECNQAMPTVDIVCIHSSSFGLLVGGDVRDTSICLLKLLCVVRIHYRHVDRERTSHFVGR